MNRAALQLRRWMGPARCRHDAEWQLATIDRDHAERLLDAAVRTLEARGHDVASALRTSDAAERSLILLAGSPGSAADTCDRHTPIAVATDLLAMADHDLRVAHEHRAAAAERVTHWRRALETAAADERRALTAYQMTDYLAAVGRPGARAARCDEGTARAGSTQDLRNSSYPRRS